MVILCCFRLVINFPDLICNLFAVGFSRLRTHAQDFPNYLLSQRLPILAILIIGQLAGGDFQLVPAPAAALFVYFSNIYLCLTLPIAAHARCNLRSLLFGFDGFEFQFGPGFFLFRFQTRARVSGRLAGSFATKFAASLVDGLKTSNSKPLRFKSERQSFGSGFVVFSIQSVLLGPI